MRPTPTESAKTEQLAGERGQPGVERALEAEAIPAETPGVLVAGEVVEFGEQAPRYEIVRPLGEGGMAVVYLARRVGASAMPPLVAVKCIVAARESEEETRRSFIQEAELARELHHPNIAEVYAMVQRGQRHHMLLEYVDGVTLQEVIEASARHGARPTEAFCCHVIARIAEALEYAHTRVGPDGPLGIVHRDVKPSNIMVASSGAVKLLDFGVAHADLPDRDRTQIGMVRGTYRYLSPEQASGGKKAVDGRADLFSLGIVLVELLTGTPPLDGDDGTRMTYGPTKRVAVHLATRRMPRQLAAICHQAMERDPALRFQDGTEFARALEGYLATRGTTFLQGDCISELQAIGLMRDVPVRKRAAVTERPAAKLARRNVLMGTAAALLAIGAVALGVVVVHLRSARTAVAVTTVEGTPSPAAAVSTAPGVASTATAAQSAVASDRELPGPIVRPKRRAERKASASGRGPAVAGDAGKAQRQVAAPAPTIPKGVLVPVKLERPVDTTVGGAVHAVVTDDVVYGGEVVVPSGSAVSCRARPASEDRLPVNCDEIKTAAGVVAFSGIAVGEGHRVGLRALDTEVAAGTPFQVYVSASTR